MRTALIETVQPLVASVKLCENSTDGRVFLEGVSIEGEVENGNGRLYPKHEIERAVNKINDLVASGNTILGECDHPESLVVSIERASHMIRKMWMVENNGHARFEVVPVGLGQIVTGFIRFGAKLGVSSRGQGSLDSRNRVSDFDIVTIDMVATPSAPNAFPRPVMESLASTKIGRNTCDVFESVRRDPKAEKYIEKQLLEFIKSVTEN